MIPNALRNSGLNLAMKNNLTARSYKEGQKSHKFKYMNLKRNMNRNSQLKKLNHTYSTFNKNLAPRSG